MRPLLMLVGVSAVLGSGCVEPATEPASADRTEDPAAAPKDGPNTGPVVCALRGEPTCELGKAPKLAVTLVNQTGADIYLVGSLDASYCKWRYPFCYFEVTGPAGRLPDWTGARCGNMNALREQDFVKVPPGGTFDPYQHIDSYGFFSTPQLSSGTFAQPGTYRIRFVYSSQSADIRAWGGDGRDTVAADEKLVALFARVPKVEVRSNEFALTVVAPPK